MASYYGINADYSSTFFSDFFGTSSSSSTSTTSSTGTTLTDYAMIRNGTYRKLMNAYYDKQASSESEVDEDETKALQTAKGDAKTLYNTTSGLMNTEFEEENEEEILKNVKAFVEDYNSLIESAGEVDTKSVLKNTVWLTDLASSYANVLGKAGITIGSDNKLELDEEALKTANLSELESVFTGSNSFTDQVLKKANQIYNLSTQAIASSTSSTYTSSGTYSTLTTGSVYDDLF